MAQFAVDIGLEDQSRDEPDPDPIGDEEYLYIVSGGNFASAERLGRADAESVFRWVMLAARSAQRVETINEYRKERLAMEGKLRDA